MAEPSYKSPGLEELFKELFGVDRIAAIESDRCVAEPIGCGQPADNFDNALEYEEYKISGLCGSCQAKIFVPEDDDED